MIPILLFLLLAVYAFFSLKCNRDIFSPAKFYHVSLTVYFLDIFLTEHHPYVYAVYFGFILVGFFISIIEHSMRPVPTVIRLRPQPSSKSPVRLAIVLWLLSIVPLSAYLYLIHISGGITFLLEIIAYRVAKWQGLGILVELAKLIGPINLVYFALGLVYTPHKPLLWWLFYGLHLLLFWGSALLLGGRSFMLMQMLAMLILYNYLKKPIRLRTAFLTGTILLAAASVLGTVRNNLTRLRSMDDIFDMHGETFNLKAFSYGTMPLDIIFTHDFTDYQFGTTYLSALTNFIPRKIWPDKLDTGGVVLTKFAHGHYYAGTYNLSPGIVAESILNFGFLAGIPFSFGLLLSVCLAIVRVYSLFLKKVRYSEGLIRVFQGVLYVYLAFIPSDLLYGEFTNIFVGRTMRILFLSLIIIILRIRILANRTW